MRRPSFAGSNYFSCSGSYGDPKAHVIGYGSNYNPNRHASDKAYS